jgi:hypothetical protein
MQKATDDRLPTPAVFAFLAASLGEMADRVKRLEDHAEPMIGASPRRAELLVVLQDFDLIRQMMEDCAGLCTAASLRGGVLHRSMAGTLRLAALREKLLQDPSSGPVQGRIPTDAPKGTGTLDLFDSGDKQAPPSRNDLPAAFPDVRQA